MRLIDADEFEVVTTKIPDGMDAESYMAGMDFVLNKIDDAPTVVEFDGEITKVVVRGKEYINPECGAETKGDSDG